MRSAVGIQNANVLFLAQN